jgi:hypothetical protein
MKSGDIFNDQNPKWVDAGIYASPYPMGAEQAHANGAPVQTGFIQTVCGECKTPISLSPFYQINGLASCLTCHYNHSITKNVLPRPYKMPRGRTPMKPEPQGRLGGWNIK